MIRFVTLYLGLVLGPHQVQLMVADGVARVELHLDGREVARLDAPPWRTVVDFGERLEPHVLEAVGFDSEDVELERARQEVNRPRPEAEAAVLLERDDSGRPVAARLTWQTLMEMRPLEVTVTLDGERLPAGDPERLPLPRVDPERFHLLQAELRFAGEITAHTQIAFGGRYLDEASSSLTALPVRLDGRRPDLDALSGRVRCGTEPLRVVAIESGPVELIVVRGDGVGEVVTTIDGLPFTGAGSVPAGLGGPGLGASTVVAGASDRQRTSLRIPQDWEVRLMGTRARRVEHRYLTMDSFLTTTPVDRDQSGLFWLLSSRLHAAGDPSPERVADAVAVAGMRVALGNRRRAVVLARARAVGEEMSTLRAEEVGRYLDLLGVPLYTWWLGSGPPPAGWPEGERIADFGDLRSAWRALVKELDRQRVLWLEGTCASDEIVLGDDSGVGRLGRHGAG